MFEDLWLVEVEDLMGKIINKRIFEDEQRAKAYFRSRAEDTKVNVRLYSPIREGV